MSGPVVLVGSASDEHVVAVAEAVRARGVDAVVFDSKAFPWQAKLSFGESLEEIVLDGRPVGRPRAVYLRSLYGSPIGFDVEAEAEMERSWRRTLVAFREKGEMLSSLIQRWEALEVPIFNSLRVGDETRKPYQIARLAAAGLPVPETLWSNEPERVRAFAAGRRVVYKPVRGGAATKELKPEDLTEERLGALSSAAVCFQELLPGADLRVYIVADQVVSAYQIETAALDYRGHEQSIRSIDLSADLTDVARRAARLLRMRFTGIDFKHDAQGRAKLLELNSSPMFLGFDERAGSNVLGALADALVDPL